MTKSGGDRKKPQVLPLLCDQGQDDNSLWDEGKSRAALGAGDDDVIASLVEAVFALSRVGDHL